MTVAPKVLRHWLPHRGNLLQWRLTCAAGDAGTKV